MPGEWPPDFDLPGNLVTFRVLEPYAVKVARTVLRRERRGNPPDLSGPSHTETITDLVFAVPTRQLYHDMTTCAHLPGLYDLEI